jgi:hypothetical protein
MVWPSKRELESRPGSEFTVSLSLAIAVPRDIYGISNSHKLIALLRVGRNQSTPLLSLPAEIRGRIWAYAVGGATLRPRATSSYAYDDKRRLKRWPADSPHGLALLSVCRQIYSEAAFLPSKLGILLLDNIEISWLTHARSAISQLKPYQRRQIKNVQFALLGITDVSPFRVQQMITETIWPGTRKLPSVEEIRVVIYSLCDEKPLPNETIHVDKPLILGGREIRVVIQTLDTPWMESDGEQ